MLIVAVAIALLLFVLSVSAYILLCRSVRKMAEDLHSINNSKTNMIVKVPVPNRFLESLAAEINRSLSQKREMEAKYRRMTERQRLDVTNVSHDLRTPLTSVIGYIQLLSDDGLSGEERKKYKEILLSRAKSLQTLISGFYELSRLDSGEYGFEPEPLNLQNILCEIMASFYQNFLDLGVEPKVQINEKAPPVVADENAVRRVFTNLIQNALKHNGGNFSVSLKSCGGSIFTDFENDAPQLKEEDAEHLFERFYTADRVRSGQNTGLGLAIVKELIEGMDGQIDAKIKNGRLRFSVRWKSAR